MLFNSLEYIFIFLPVTATMYFLLQSTKGEYASRVWLVFASLAFYSVWGFAFLPVLLTSILTNYLLGAALITIPSGKLLRKGVLFAGITFNVSLLGYYKYANFIVDTLNDATGAGLALKEIGLPLALSFVTFQKIAYLVDCYRGFATRYNFINYALFATFFPQLIAGPIVHHREIIPQFEDPTRRRVDWKNIEVGIAVFSLGLAKKLLVADQLAVWANAGFASADTLTFADAWCTSLSYTFQLYFDFSGYVDMAIGSALIFNIRLPINFHSPYKSVDIQDFWRRWHITLGAFLRDYIYIPLGGNQRGKARLYVNLFLTFVIGGIWHGAGWMFIIWGALHGAALVIHRMWKGAGLALPSFVAWLVTFNFVNVTWVFFRAENMDSALNILKGMITPFLARVPGKALEALSGHILQIGLFVASALAICILLPTALRFATDRQNTPATFVLCGLAFGASTLALLAINAAPSQFLYFNF